MKLDVSNIKVAPHENGYTIRIMMPDGSGNYLHTDVFSLESVLIIRSLIMDIEIYEQDVSIIEDDRYYRLNLLIEDCNNDKYLFHSRKLNLNDAIFERDQLLIDT